MAHFLRFLVVGTIGFIINTVVLIFGVKIGFKPYISGPAGAELAILSNFLLNNFWTFSDKSITSWTVLPGKFVQFNVLSFGSVIIQFVFLKIGEVLFGVKEFKKPFINWPLLKKVSLVKLAISIVKCLPFGNKLLEKLSAYFVFYVMGVAVGLVVNFFIYSQLIWK